MTSKVDLDVKLSTNIFRSSMVHVYSVAYSLTCLFRTEIIEEKLEIKNSCSFLFFNYFKLMTGDSFVETLDHTLQNHRIQFLLVPESRTSTQLTNQLEYILHWW